MPRVSYWLMPAEADRRRLSRLIEELAARFEAPLFDAHVTLYSGPLQESDAVSSILENTANVFSPMELQVIGTGHSEQFTKTLYWTLSNNETLAGLSRALRQQMTTPSNYTLDPHLSLIYAALPEAARRQAAAELIPPQAIRFDAIRAIRHHGVSSRRDVESWEQVAEVRLKPG